NPSGRKHLQRVSVRNCVFVRADLQNFAVTCVNCVLELRSVHSDYGGTEKPVQKIKTAIIGSPAEGLPGGKVMQVDCRLYVRDLALAAILFAAAGLNTAAYAQSLNALANMKTPSFVLDPSWPKPLPAPVTNGVAHTWVQGEVAGNCVDLQNNVYTFNRGWE